MTGPAPDPAPERVFDGALLQARLWTPPQGARTLYVTFRQRLAAPGSFAATGPVRQALDRGIAQLHLQTRWNDWYLNAETAALEAALRDVRARFDQALALGYSMGAYAALRFSAALDLSRVVLVSPIATLDPAVMPQDRRYPERQAFDAALGDPARHGKRDLGGVLLYDPFRPLDRAHAVYIQHLFPGLAAARLAFGGHPATGPLGQTGGFRTLQDLSLQPAPSAGAIVRLHRRLRRDAALYWQHRAQACLDRGWTAEAARAAARVEALSAPPSG